ncbi:Uncharacterised protein [Vibrio cholerae]|uniref:Uncharacterized protein n=1 Tax=Vibrio cholerae TaxID=666 RepID=A0A655WNH9_VIBCL|nr:Uncharacterised protein [Vibrio cholerae]CSB37342.1 Uncharacterised protein [Vibrio cholerae]CSB71504.1 Uncharacterised protein [Vibrio cholerae]CSB93014.1 Uncharacterised protein [Vibrio cholerae]CSC05467.1 Uncharacterised protein [Vibrio cholerae]
MSELVPHTSETNTSGTTNIFKLAIKILPPTSNSPLTIYASTNPFPANRARIANPVKIPATIPRMTLAVSDNGFLVFIQNTPYSFSL